MKVFQMLVHLRLVAFACLLFGNALHAQITATEGATQCQEELQPYVDRHELAGAVMLVADKDQIVLSDAVGWADIEEAREMRADTVFWIASQSKPMTSAALMMLVDAADVTLDDPVAKYLPEFEHVMLKVESDAAHILLKKPSNVLTVRHLLSHTSGLPFKSLLEEPTLDQFRLAARVRSYAMTPLEYEPGTNYQYSNAGINTAARIIEVVTGQSFEQFMDERLFKPLSMKDTTFWPTEEQAARIAKSYKPAGLDGGLAETTITQLYYPLADRTIRMPMPAGGLFSTAEDISKFYQMLLNDGEFLGREILSPEAVAEMTKRQTPENVQASYGFGLSVSDITFGHGGAYSTNTIADKERGLIFIWLVQHAGFPGEGAKCQEIFRKRAVEILSNR